MTSLNGDDFVKSWRRQRQEKVVLDGNKSMILSEANSLPLGNIWQSPVTFFGCHNWKSATGI